MEKTITAAYTARKITPLLAVADMDETLAFCHDVLGFSAGMKSAEYAIVARDGQTIHFMKAASEEVMRCLRGHILKSTSKFRVLTCCGSRSRVSKTATASATYSIEITA
jgi:hypothetical protein